MTLQPNVSYSVWLEHVPQ